MTRLAAHPARLLTLAAGFLIWHLALILLYALFSIGCEAGWEQLRAGPLSVQRALLLAVWLLHLAVLAGFLWLIWRLRRGDGDRGPAYRFVGTVAAGLTLWALLAALGLGVPLLGTTACL